MKNKRYLYLGAILAVAAAVAINSESNAAETKTETVDNRVASTVLITNLAGNSGGTGSVVETTASKSTILTNVHVCELLKNGGGKVTDSEKNVFLPTEMRQSQEHDLCPITVTGSLPKAVKLADSAPKIMDEISISGHPALLPTTVTKGHLGDSMVIQVFTGIEPCVKKDVETLNGAMMCLFFGGIPVIKTFQSAYTTATIMPGSSGSAVYNSKNELIGVVFAGAGELSYAHTVPYSYVKEFLQKGKTQKATKIDYKLNVRALLKGQTQHSVIVKKCKDEVKNQYIENICKIVIETEKWIK